MATLVLFLNVEERLASSKEQFVVIGRNLLEKLDDVVKFSKIVAKDLKYLESKVFQIENSQIKIKNSPSQIK